MRIRLPGIFTAVKLEAAVCGFRLSSFPRRRACPPGKRVALVSAFSASLPGGPAGMFGGGRRGQTTVEYLLMLAVVAGMALVLGVLFYRQILGGFFTVVGLILGAGTPV